MTWPLPRWHILWSGSTQTNSAKSLSEWETSIPHASSSAQWENDARSGFAEIVVEAGICASGSLEKVMSGIH